MLSVGQSQWLKRARQSASTLCRLRRETLVFSHSSSCAQKRLFGQEAQQAPWIVRAEDANHQDLAAESIVKHGFVILKDFFDADELKTLTEPATSKAKEVMGMLQTKRVSLGIGSRAGFREVCLRSPGRYDVPCGFEEFPSQLLERIEGIASKVLAEGTSKVSEEGLEGLEPQGLGRAFAGLVRAQPKSEAQIWHADSPHSFPEHRAPHLLNVLVPSETVTREMGPTELVPGSHLLTNHLKDGAAFGTEILYQADTNSPQKIGSSQEPIAATMDAGSVLIFDDRILHRGGHNRATCDRDVAFFSYRKADFFPSTHYESVRTLKTYDHTAMAAAVRSEFPGLRTHGTHGGTHGKEVPVLADGASGSQVHETLGLPLETLRTLNLRFFSVLQRSLVFFRSVLEAMMDQLRFGTANIGGSYDSSRRAEHAVSSARSAMAQIAFGPSMTALVYHLSRAFRNGKVFAAGDNIVLDPISHGANVWPWVQLAKPHGVEDLSRCALDANRDAVAAVVDNRTRLVAIGAASNGVGTAHDITSLCHTARQLSDGKAWTFVDAVHYAPHGHLDVQSISCDFLACSPYKFFGPHAGVLYGRRATLESLPADRLESWRKSRGGTDCSDNSLPSIENGNMSRWELGTQNYEALAGVTAAVKYIAQLGDRFGGADVDATMTERIETGFRAICAHENELKCRMLEGLQSIPNVSLLGVADPEEELANKLCERGIWCTAGNHYAGFWEKHGATVEGMTRLGLLHYNTLEEVDRILEAMEDA
eukprot:s2287_g3.t1